MRKSPRLSKRWWLGLTLSAVFVPLGLLLFLQYLSLSNLAEKSAIADGARLGNYLEAVVDQTDGFYETQASRALYFPPSLFATMEPRRVIQHFRTRIPEGVTLLFAVRFEDGAEPLQVVYDPIADRPGMPEDPAISRAIQVATAPWKVLAGRGVPLRDARVSVDERDPNVRVLLMPIALGEECRVIGVAGMILDPSHFVETVLPAAIDEALPRFLGSQNPQQLAVTVLDGRGRLVLGERQAGRISDEEVSRQFQLVFTDWVVTLENLARSPEQVAKANFTLNLSMSVLLALAMTGGVLWTVRTVSREMRLSQMKADFVSNVSHELRTPLASIRVFAELLMGGRVKSLDKAEEYGRYIETESRRLTGLVDNILDFSRIESGAKTYELTVGDLRAEVSAMVRSLRTSLEHRGVNLELVDTDPSWPPAAFDRAAVNQAVANLVDNAVKYSDGQDVTVRLVREPARLRIDVVDQGIGISEEEQSKIFDRFHRVHTGFVHDVKGAGLGLSIVSHIMQAHGGRVDVASRRGEGSTFSLIFPVAPAHADGEGVTGRGAA